MKIIELRLNKIKNYQEVIILSKIKIHELAKELKIENKEIIELANKLGMNVTSHLNAIEDKEADKIRKT